MKQVSHSEKIVPLLKEEPAEDIEERLRAMLSHSDGIRGFFVTYLTVVGDDTPADQSEVPKALVAAMEAADCKDLIPLACMNVVMPTAMITMHTDPELSQQSQKTAERGVRVLAALKGADDVEKQCNAILAVATDRKDEADADLVKYWEEFFEKWGYKDIQKRDIEQAIRSVISTGS